MIEPSRDDTSVFFSLKTQSNRWNLTPHTQGEKPDSNINHMNKLTSKNK